MRNQFTLTNRKMQKMMQRNKVMMNCDFMCMCEMMADKVRIVV
ncbi:hypothetical protein [Sporanaerobium hydrogeniformans]|nr:hypothetical protein [Sporanaerobium hydrogeniformans]